MQLSVAFCLEKWRNILMTKKFVYYQEDDMFIGWLEEFPNYRTQGTSLDELMDNLEDIYSELISQ